MAIKFYCDICGQEISGTMYTLSVTPIDVNSIYLSKHLCKDCIKELEGTFKMMSIKNKKPEIHDEFEITGYDMRGEANYG